MTTFGISAFLRIACSNPKPQHSMLRARLLGTKKGGYDFHAGMRRKAKAFLAGSISLDDVQKEIAEIKNEPERASAIAALTQLAKWRASHPGPISRLDSVEYGSPSGLFKIRFEPDFSMQLGPLQTAIHIWNTKAPKLDSRLAAATLSLIHGSYSGGARPDDIAILSARDLRLIRLSEYPSAMDIGLNLANRIEDIIESILSDGQPAVRPSAPPPLTL